MSKEKLKAYSSLYKNELVNNILPFWLENSKDELNDAAVTDEKPNPFAVLKNLK